MATNDQLSTVGSLDCVQIWETVKGSLDGCAPGLPLDLVTLMVKYVWDPLLIPTTMRLIQHQHANKCVIGIWMHEEQTVFQWMDWFQEAENIPDFNFRMLLELSDRRFIRLMRPFQTWKDIEKEYGCDMNVAMIHVVMLSMGDYHSFSPQDVVRFHALRSRPVERIRFWLVDFLVEGLTEEETAMIMSLSPKQWSQPAVAPWCLKGVPMSSFRFCYKLV